MLIAKAIWFVTIVALIHKELEALIHKDREQQTAALRRVHALTFAAAATIVMQGRVILPHQICALATTVLIVAKVL